LCVALDTDQRYARTFLLLRYYFRFCCWTTWESLFKICRRK